jgi:hypothetical protein
VTHRSDADENKIVVPLTLAPIKDIVAQSTPWMKMYIILESLFKRVLVIAISSPALTDMVMVPVRQRWNSKQPAAKAHSKKIYRNVWVGGRGKSVSV